MKINGILISALLAVSFSASASDMIDSEYYQRTQDTYIKDIDTINVVMSSMDSSCWGNAPYGMPFDSKEGGLISPSWCDEVNFSFQSRPRNTEGQAVIHALYVVSTPDLSGGVEPLRSTLVKKTLPKAFYSPRQKMTLSLSSEIADAYSKVIDVFLADHKRSQQGIPSDELKFAPPQVINTIIAESGGEIFIYADSLNGISGEKALFRIDGEGARQIDQVTFKSETSLVTNALYRN